MDSITQRLASISEGLYIAHLEVRSLSIAGISAPTLVSALKKIQELQQQVVQLQENIAASQRAKTAEG